MDDTLPADWKEAVLVEGVDNVGGNLEVVLGGLCLLVVRWVYNIWAVASCPIPHLIFCILFCELIILLLSPPSCYSWSLLAAGLGTIVKSCSPHSPSLPRSPLEPASQPQIQYT